MNPKFPGFIAAGRYYASFIATHQHRFSFQGGVVDYFNRYKKRIQIKMGNIAGVLRHESSKLSKVRKPGRITQTRDSSNYSKEKESGERRAESGERRALSFEVIYSIFPSGIEHR
jgi:hypothetical protein